GGVGLLKDLLEAPGEGRATPGIVDVRQQGRRQPAVWPRFPGQAWSLGTREELPQLCPQSVWLARVAPNARGLPDRAGQVLAKAGSIEEEGLLHLGDERGQQIDRHQHAARLAHHFLLDLANVPLAIEQLNAGELKHAQALLALAEAALVPDDI